MFSKIKVWVNKPYYFNPSIKYKYKLCLILGVFLFVFLYIFQPFSLSSFGNYLLSYTLGIGIISTISGLLLMVIFPLLFPKFFDEDSWTLGKNLVFIIGCLFAIGNLLWVHGYYFKLDTNITHIPYFRFLYYTLLVGLFPIFGYTLVNQNQIQKKLSDKAAEINELKKRFSLKIDVPEVINFSSENNKESIEIELKKLIYITSEGNYASFFILEDNTLKEYILRVTLSKIEDYLKNVKNFIRCHKSYIVNTNYVKHISGNARGYLLTIDCLNFDVPVSRKFSRNSLVGLLN